MSQEDIYNFLKIKTNADIAYSILPYIFTRPPFISELLKETQSLRSNLSQSSDEKVMYLNISIQPKITNCAVDKYKPHWTLGWDIKLK